MSIITWPGLKVASIRWKRVDLGIVNRSVFGSQVIGTGAPLWAVELVGVPQYWAEAHSISAVLESLGGYANQLALWHLAQPYPLGTMRGEMVLISNAAQGETSLQIIAPGQAGKTLKRGDLLGIGSGTTQQVVRNAADATADSGGEITVSLTGPIRNAFSAGTSVTWDKPKALFRQASINDGIEYQSVIGQPWSLSLIESWAP
jgi:hypothetical protein